MKKKLAATLSVVLILGLAVLGILAYLTSEDSDVNVMTLGNVKIEQHEYQRAEGVAYNATASKDEGTLVNFKQGQTLYPAVPTGDLPYTAAKKMENGFKWGDYVTAEGAWNGLWDDSKLGNVMDKMVFVENTGKSDAYIRTIIAYECPEGMTVDDAGTGDDIGLNVNSLWNETYIGSITISGVRYEVCEYNYTIDEGALAAGATARPSLLQVVMNHELDNEDVAKFGDTYEILVMSQAVQTEGFENAQTALDTAFGDVTAENVAKWFGDVKVPVVVTSAEDLTAALLAKDNVVLKGTINGEEITYPYGEENSDFTAEYYAKKVASIEGGNLILDNNRYDGMFAFEVGSIKDTVITGKNRNTLTIQNRNVTTTLENITVTATNGSAITVENGGAGVVLNNVTVNQSGIGAGVPNYLETALFVSANSKVTINGGTYTSTKNALRTAGSGASTVTINGGSFNGGIYVAAVNGDTVIVNGGTFSVDPRTIEGVTVNGTVTNVNGKFVVK